MTCRLFVRKAARADVAEAFRWYEEHRLGLGHEFARTVRVTLSTIQRNPLRYPVAIDDIRKAALGRFPYTVYFVVLERGISVIAVMHGRRDPATWMQRR